MRLESLTLLAFGAFRDRSEPLAPGLNVVYGPNEAGKSTWHAAAYAALCGVRRGRGQGKEERAFEERHRPWAGKEWLAGTVLTLADGRRVELRQDLSGKVGSRAIDLALGRDVTAEILCEGSPDGSRWLGLDRRAFAATACVRQADVLAVTEDPSLLTDHLQRAAATAGTDATAAAALHRIEEYRREHVGRDRAGSVRPLRRAHEEVLRLTRSLTAARDEHEGYVRLAAQADRLQQRAAACEADLHAHRAALAAARAAELASRLAGAEELAARRPLPPAGELAGQELALRAGSALRAWRESAAGVDVEPGDTVVDPGVRDAARGWERARDQLDGHRRSRPAEAEPVAAAVSEDVLRELVHELEVPDPPVDPTLLARREAAERVRQATDGWMPAWPALAGLAGLLLVAVAGVVGRSPAVVGGALALAVAVGAGSAVVRSGRHGRALAELSDVERHLAGMRLATERRRAAAERARGLGLPDRAPALRELAAAAAAAEGRSAGRREWERVEAELAAIAAAAEDRLGLALERRGAEPGPDLGATLEAYDHACRRRWEQAAHAEARQTAGARAEREVRQAAAEAGLEARGDLSALAGALDAWQRERREELAGERRAAEEWGRLQELLGGRSLEELRGEALAAAAEAAELGRGADPERVRAAAALPDLSVRIDGLRRELEAARAEAERTRGELRGVAGRLPSVPDAEEALERARAELDRVQGLDRILELTRGFLEAAQEQVHRDVAPQLAAALREWLPGITGGRYTDAIVDPRTLEVKVCGPRREWRDAGLLSQGTREQVYLLLRIALVERLTGRGESSPLLLDEVTVHSDQARTAALLELLHEASRSHQVLLFTQEEQVAAWARANLRAPDDRLLVLEGPPAST